MLKRIFFIVAISLSPNLLWSAPSVRLVNISTNTLTRQIGTLYIAGADISTTTISSGTVSTQLTVSSNIVVGAVATPSYPLDVRGSLRSIETSNNPLRGVISNQISTDQASGHHAGFKARGTPTALLPVVANDYIASLIPDPYDGFQYLIPGQAVFQVTPGSVVSNGVVYTDFVIMTSSGIPDGLDRLRVSWDGHVGINQGVNTTDTSGTLAVTALASTNALRLRNNDASFATLNIINNNASGSGINTNTNLFFSAAGTGVLGQTNNTAPGSTLVGYQTTCDGSGNFPTTDQYGDVCNITVAAGTWEFRTMLNFTGQSITGVYFLGGIGTATGNNGAGITQGSTAAYGGFVTGRNETVTVPSYRVSVAGSTTYYFKVLGSYSAGTPAYAGRMWATRVY